MIGFASPGTMARIQLIDDLSGAVRTAAACLRGAEQLSPRDGAYLQELALEALERAEAALDASMAAPVQ